MKFQFYGDGVADNQLETNLAFSGHLVMYQLQGIWFQVEITRVYNSFQTHQCILSSLPVGINILFSTYVVRNTN